MPFFKPTKFYSRQQGSTTFNFYYSANKQLVAEIVRDGNTQQLQVDIPRDFQTDLDEAKRNKLKTMFDQSYFGIQCEKLLVNARGLGGWNEDVHKGYTDTRVTPYYNTQGRLIEIERRTTEYGTYRLALNVDFRDSDAKIIADACQGVDDRLFTGPFPLVGNQRRHFDSYQNTWENWATDNDPRIQYVRRALATAIQLREEGNNERSLRTLGTGLHSLQDLFAHTPDFVTCIYLCGHVGNPDPDNILTNPQLRFEYTKQATTLYLRGYLSGDYAQAEVNLNSFLQHVRQNPPKIPSQRDQLIAQSISSGGGDPSISFQPHTVTR